ncbi:MAG: ATPase, T2SS/T4P/T4SS family [Eubacteriales bacterium]|nr:ATPase, T2SS/T4P/T4SS family [Eubacteriales bacterium]
MTYENGFQKVRIGDVLKAWGCMTEQQESQALEYQNSHPGIRMGEALVALGFITKRQMVEALAASLKLQVGDVSRMDVNLDAVQKIPMEMSQRYRILGVRIEGDVLTVLTDDPLNYYGLEDVRQTSGMSLHILLCEEELLVNAIRYYYAELNAREAARAANSSQISEMEQMRADDDDTPVVNLLNSLVERAYHSQASDIHVEPFEDRTRVRMRIDGVILEFVTLQKSLHAPLIARIKILSDLDIAERRIPQDGHMRMQVDAQPVNMRVSILPTVFGEKAVIRLLAGNTRIDHRDTFGMERGDYEKLIRMLRLPNGLLYLTGPTGSGKTTTLYMILEELAKGQVNISTIEDPVERNLPGINQCQVNPVAGLTFQTGLRAILRQDPDVIMVGETRDRETAAISVRAAITGHLVLSTLHTRDALSAIVRLEDLGVEPYLAADALAGVVAQRLMRKLCRVCGREVEPDETARRYLGAGVTRIKAPVGCPCCNGTGYSGRIAIHEVVYVDRTMREMIAAHADSREIRRYALEQQGMRTLRESGASLVAGGITSMEELLRVVCDE